MVYEDTYRLRQINDLKIQKDLNSISLLKKCIGESKEQTNKMTSLLDGIEIRLSGLHDLIVPVYDSTNTLQIKHSNLEKAVVQLDNILEYYDAVKNLSVVIQAGPGQDIATYLNQMDKLKSAIQYFSINKNKSQKSENEELWMKGKMNVDREFESFLNKFNVIKANFTNDNIDHVDNGKIFGPKENDLKQMKCIMDWFKKTEPTYLDKLYEKIINNRSQLILDNLRNIKGKTNSLKNSGNSLAYNLNNSNSSQFTKRNSLAPQSPGSNLNNSFNENADSKRSTLRSRLTENLFSSNDTKRKVSKANLNDSYSSTVQLNKLTNISNFDEENEVNDCSKFTQLIEKTLLAFQIEVKFIFKLIESDKQMAMKLLGCIYEPVLRFLNTESERLANNVKQISKKPTSKYIVSLLNILSEMVKTKPKFLEIFEHSTLKTSRHLNKISQIFLELFVNFERACVDYFKDVLDSIRNDTQTIHQNGNIHPLTTETLTYIGNVLPFDVIAGFISSVVVSKDSNQLMPSELEIKLRREASEKNIANFKRIAYQVESIPEKKVFREQLADYFYRLFLYLNYNLKKKADCYQDQNLKYIFLLNNIHKIKKVLFNVPNIRKENVDQCDSLFELFVLANKLDLKNHYETEILNYKREYSKCWSKLMSFIRDLIDRNPFHGEKLKDKDRQILKDRFSGFNKEFEEIYEAQKRYYIPSEQHDLAEEIRQDNVLYVGLQYQKFYDIYSRYNFATNRDKYVKYTPNALNAMLREFFTAF